MRTRASHIPFIVSAILLCILVVLYYPYCRFYVDPDATAYLTISEKYASGDWMRAVNGYWSPFSCWLTALVMKTGFLPLPSAIIVNTAGAIGYLLVSHSFFRKFSLHTISQFASGIALAVFLSYAVYKQTFDDLWQCFFLLCCLRIMLMKAFTQMPALWVIMGFTGSFAYFAKAYAFPFFILHTLVVGGVVCKVWVKEFRWLWIKMCVVSILVMLVCSAPWLYFLHEKYNIWTTGTAGRLNMSWYLTGHPYWKDGITQLVPPAYADAVYYWEDPYLANGKTPMLFDSLKLFLLQIMKSAYNLLKLVKSMNELSTFVLPAFLLAGLIACSKKMRSFFSSAMLPLSVSTLLFPLGFILINFEARYIWYVVPLCIVLGALAIQYLSLMHGFGRRLYITNVLVFSATFIAWPLLDMRSMIYEGKNDNDIAKAMQAAGINGSFAAKGRYGDGNVPSIARIAYFSGNPYYHIPGDISDKQLLSEIQRYHVKYYIHLGSDEMLFRGIDGIPYQDVLRDKVKGIKVFLINP